MMIKNITNRWCEIFIIVGVFILAATQIKDTDAWMHLNLGRTIWENGGIPDFESFVYTSKELPFLYSSWLFGVINYIAYLLFGSFGVVTLKAASISLTFWILYLDSRQRGAAQWLTLFLLILFAIMMRGRFLERPDTLLFLFIAATVYLTNRFAKDDSFKYIYLLPVIHIFWANIHSSVILMIVPYIATILGGGFYYWLATKGIKNNQAPSIASLKILFILFFVSLSVSLINPNGVTQLFFGQSILSTSFFTEEIHELQPPTWETAKFTFIVAASISLSFILKILLAITDRSGNKLDNLPSIIDIGLLLPLFVASLMSFRFVFPLCIITLPIIASYFSDALNLFSFTKKQKQGLILLWSSAMISLTAIILSIVFSIPNDSQRFGFREDLSNVPESALSFMDKNNITGKVFNFFDWGGYIAWRDNDKRSVFVDPRGYVPAKYQEDISNAFASFKRLNSLQRELGFESVLNKYTPDIESKNSPFIGGQLPNTPGWALVFWDDNTLLYLRRHGPYQHLINKFEYKYANPLWGIAPLGSTFKNENLRQKVIQELLRNQEQTNSISGKLLLGYIYAQTNQPDKAGNILIPLTKIENNYVRALAQRWLGLNYEKQRKYSDAINAYLESMSGAADIETILSIGMLYFSINDIDNAKTYLELYLERNPITMDAYSTLSSIYRQQGNAKKADKLDIRQRENQSIYKSREAFNQGVRAYSSGNLYLAEEKFLSSIELNPQSVAAYTNLGYIMLSKGNISQAINYHQKALSINPNEVNSLYGLGLAFLRSGKNVQAATYFQDYLNHEPTGYYARRAKSFLEEIDR